MSKENKDLRGREIGATELGTRLPIKIIHHSLFADEENSREGILSDSDELSECRRIRDFGEKILDPSDLSKELNRFIPYTRNRDYFSDKFTLGANRCLVAVFLGLSKINPTQPISVIYHIQPGVFAPDLYGENHRMDYEVKMMVLKKSIARLNSVQAIIVGGSMQKDEISDFCEEMFPKNAAKWLRETHDKYLDAPTIIIPPKKLKGFTSVYVATRESEVYVVNHYIKPQIA